VKAEQNVASRYVERRVALFSAALLALMFGVTALLARSYHAREEGLAAEWYQLGSRELDAGKPERAIEDFRNSLSYGPDNREVQLRLAEALLADGRFSETRSYLVNLWESAPGSGQVNLDLARLAVRSGDVDDAIRYFHGAILGGWDKEPIAQRRKVRLELCEFLLERGLINEGRAEIAGLVVDTPPDDGELHEQDARLFLKVGEPAKALTELEIAIRSNPRESRWLTETGRVALEDGDYFKAETYFSRAERAGPSEENRAALELVHDVLGNDPFLDGLNEEEQARRIWRDFGQVTERLSECADTLKKNASLEPPASDLQALQKEERELHRRANLRLLAQNDEMRADVMNFVARVENAVSRRCGPGTTADQALKIIERRHEVNSQ
jgi:tetratricopeptide (TPR) repeat protein